MKIDILHNAQDVLKKYFIVKEYKEMQNFLSNKYNIAFDIHEENKDNYLLSNEQTNKNDMLNYETLELVKSKIGFIELNKNSIAIFHLSLKQNNNSLLNIKIYKKKIDGHSYKFGCCSNKIISSDFLFKDEYLNLVLNPYKKISCYNLSNELCKLFLLHLGVPAETINVFDNIALNYFLDLKKSYREYHMSSLSMSFNFGNIKPFILFCMQMSEEEKEYIQNLDIKIMLYILTKNIFDIDENLDLNIYKKFFNLISCYIDKNKTLLDKMTCFDYFVKQLYPYFYQEENLYDIHSVSKPYILPKYVSSDKYIKYMYKMRLSFECITSFSFFDNKDKKDFSVFLTKYEKEIEYFFEQYQILLDKIKNTYNNKNIFEYLFFFFFVFVKLGLQKEKYEHFFNIVCHNIQNFSKVYFDIRSSKMVFVYFFDKQLNDFSEKFKVLTIDLISLNIQRDKSIKILFNIINDSKLNVIKKIITDDENIQIQDWVRKICTTTFAEKKIKKIEFGSANKYNFFATIDSRIIGNMLKTDKDINFIATCLYSLYRKGAQNTNTTNMILNWLCKNRKDIWKAWRYSNYNYEDFLDYAYEENPNGLKPFNDKMSFITANNMSIAFHNLHVTEGYIYNQHTMFPKTPVEMQIIDKITIKPLIKPIELVEESNEMQHCVKSYMSKVSNGISYIFAVIGENYDDRATMELDIKTNTIIQLRSYFNNQVTTKIQNTVKKWCTKNNISFNI